MRFNMFVTIADRSKSLVTNSATVWFLPVMIMHMNFMTRRMSKCFFAKIALIRLLARMNSHMLITITLTHKTLLAIETLVWFLPHVYLQMNGKPSLLHEHFGAVCALKRLLFGVLETPMSVQQRRCRKIAVTYRTREGLFTGVLPQVGFVQMWIGECAVTLRTFVWLIAGMDLLVGLKMIQTAKRFHTGGAFVRLLSGVDPHMDAALVHQSKPFVTHGTSEGFFTCVHPHVQCQIHRLDKRSLTKCTLEWSVAKMNPHVRPVVTRLTERLITECTLKRFLTGVCSHMLLVISSMIEQFPTDITLK